MRLEGISFGVSCFERLKKRREEKRV